MHYGAGARGFSSRNPIALALIFGMHILALLAWMQQRPAALPNFPHVPQVVSFLLRPAPPRPRAAPTKPAEPAATSSAPAPASAIPTSPTSPANPAAAPSLDAARAPITVDDALREQKQAGGGFGLGLSKRQAGRIDRELRKGKSGVPDEPDTPMGRFRRGLEQAHVDRSMSVYEDSYTSPDGTIIYRKHIGNASFCRRSGIVSPLGMRHMLMGNEAGDVPCPAGVQWKRE
jgi:hypothetical protein